MSLTGLLPPQPPPGGQPPGPGYFRDLHRFFEASIPRPAPGGGLFAGLGGVTPAAGAAAARRTMAPALNFPFRFRDVSTVALPFRYSVVPGGFLARGQTTPHPEVGTEGSGIYLHDDPAPVFTVGEGKDSHLILRALYDNDSSVAVWRASLVLAIETDEDDPLVLDDDWLQGSFVVLVCRRQAGEEAIGLTLRAQYVQTGIGHTKCGTAHLWWRT